MPDEHPVIRIVFVIPPSSKWRLIAQSAGPRYLSGMEWRATGILLSVRRHGETSAIIETLTAEHGRHAGLVRGGAGRKLAATLQPGNRLSLRWRARLSEHLGSFEAELAHSYAAEAMAEREALATLDSMRALACALLPEREPSAVMYRAVEAVLDKLGDEAERRRSYALWEILLLSELGFGLDLARCAATGANNDLRFVSPKSGRAVGEIAGEAYADRLLPLPPFLTGETPEPDRKGFHDALIMTGHFLERWAGQPLGMRTMPPARDRLVALVARD